VVNLFDRKVLNKEMLYRHCFSTALQYFIRGFR